MKLSFAVIASAAALVASQAIPSSIPQCGQLCINNMLAAAPALGCGATDIKCLCGNADFGNGLRDCSNQACGADVASSVLSYGSSVCASATGGSATGSATGSKTTTGSASGSASSVSGSAASAASSASKAASSIASSASGSAASVASSASKAASSVAGAATGSSSAASAPFITAAPLAGAGALAALLLL